MDSSLLHFFEQKRTEIIREWVDRLITEVGDQYAARPRRELFGTITEAYDANVDVIIDDDYHLINLFINKITTMRLEAGFLLSDVQKAFELFRRIVSSQLAGEMTLEEFSETTIRINRCLAYTIHRFSDHFQSMHEEKILEHNRKLEKEVKLRTAELKESELKYKTLVEEINDGYFVVQDEVIVFANQAFSQMHGYSQEEVIGKKFHTFVDPLNREKVIEIYNRGLEEKTTPRTFEYLRLTKNKKRHPTEILAKNTQYDYKLSSIGICRDITNRTQMEKKVRESERMAYIGQITTSLSHEIRNPLSAVKMNLQILRKNRQIQGNDQRRLDISVREVDRLEGILRELLDFAKPLSLDIRPAPVNNILSECVDLLEIKLLEKKLALDLVLDGDIPKIRADYGKMEQTFINLLLNAIDASDIGDKIQISSQYDPNGRYPRVKITIDDNGSSIPEKYLDEIFKPFFTTKTKGTGLGLATVKRIVEAHGGQVKAENRNPGGASFRVSLPIGIDNG